MPTSAITFDFHETLIHCPAWFDLEVRRLPAAVLRAVRSADDRAVDPGEAESVTVAYRALRRAIIDHGHELPAAACVELSFRRAGIEILNSSIVESIDELMREALGDAEPLAGAAEAIYAAAATGRPLGIVSSAVHHDFLIWSLDRFDLLSAFASVVTSASAGFYKSRPEIYWTALRELDADPTSSIHIGDSHRYDVEGAARAGMRTIWLNTSGEAAKEPRRRPDHEIARMSDLRACVEKG